MSHQQKCPQTGKVAHRTLGGALVHVQRLMSARGFDGGAVEPYACNHCGLFHVGHARKV